MKLLKLVKSDVCLCDKCFFKNRTYCLCDDIDYCPLDDNEYLIELTPEEYEMYQSNSDKKSSVS